MTDFVQGDDDSDGESGSARVGTGFEDIEEEEELGAVTVCVVVCRANGDRDLDRVRLVNDFKLESPEGVTKTP
ncbi:unnamed protein product [Echinostoma caproni]|uniref:Uncharacterized protein n=1 Tax=Echinostoma caproni TaxID=27848 RepID=A0A183AYU6_9TREM|nr:unnamed protein product [Echinostoma caproni]